jgi:Zn-dependent protease with chaperone function
VRTVAIAAPLAGACCFGLFGSLAARRLPPRRATWLISVGAVTSVLSALVVLALLAFVLVGQLPFLADEGEWSPAALHSHAFTEPGVGAFSLLLLLAAAVAVLGVGRQLARALLGAYRTCGEVSTGAGDLVVLPGGPDLAAAIPGRPGRIVVTESLLSTLAASERRVLLAHERAHLEHGHHWHRGAVALAAAANPLLSPLRAAIVYTTERWADEDAAREVGNRRDVATALARAALTMRQPPARHGLFMAAYAVSDRVAAMLARPSRPRPLLTAAVIVVPVVAAVAAAVVWKDTEHLFELAERVYRGSRTG